MLICIKMLGPTMGHLQHFFGKKTNAHQMPGGGGGGGGCAQLELTEPLV